MSRTFSSNDDKIFSELSVLKSDAFCRMTKRNYSYTSARVFASQRGEEGVKFTRKIMCFVFLRFLPSATQFRRIAQKKSVHLDKIVSWFFFHNHVVLVPLYHIHKALHNVSQGKKKKKKKSYHKKCFTSNFLLKIVLVISSKNLYERLKADQEGPKHVCIVQWIPI